MDVGTYRGQLLAKLAVSLVIAGGSFAVILLDGNPSADTAAFGLLSVVATGWLHTSRQMGDAPPVRIAPVPPEAPNDNNT